MNLHARLNPPWCLTCYLSDVESFDCSLPSEFDRKFLGDQSLLSALSLEQLSTSKILTETPFNGSDSRMSVLASLCLSADSISPSQGLSFDSINAQETGNRNLTVPLDVKFSTPHNLIQKPKNATCPDLTMSQVSWDVSLIKVDNSSPRFCMESSTQEQTWSPSLQKHSIAEVSP